jgi:hypothetical protein
MLSIVFAGICEKLISIEYDDGLVVLQLNNETRVPFMRRKSGVGVRVGVRRKAHLITDLLMLLDAPVTNEINARRIHVDFYTCLRPRQSRVILHKLFLINHLCIL